MKKLKKWAKGSFGGEVLRSKSTTRKPATSCTDREEASSSKPVSAPNTPKVTKTHHITIRTLERPEPLKETNTIRRRETSPKVGRTEPVKPKKVENAPKVDPPQATSTIRTIPVVQDPPKDPEPTIVENKPPPPPSVVVEQNGKVQLPAADNFDFLL